MTARVEIEEYRRARGIAADDEECHKTISGTARSKAAISRAAPALAARFSAEKVRTGSVAECCLPERRTPTSSAFPAL